MRALRSAVLALVLALTSAPAARAQVPQISGDDHSTAARIAREVLARNTYVYIDRDTTLGPDFRAPGDLVVYDAEVRLEGSVEGSAVVIGGDFWIRPGGRVGGSVAVIGGGVYPAGLAVVDRDSIHYTRPGAELQIETRPTGREGEYVASAEIIHPPRPPFFAPAVGPFPTYDRVNGLTLSASANLHPTREEGGPVINIWGAYRFEQENKLGAGVRWRVPLGVENLQLTGEASRATRTMDGWMRGDVANSVRALALGRDYRDYWDSDVLRVMVERPVGKPLIAGETWLGPRLGVQLSNDRALEARGPWALLDREGLERFNPPAIEGTFVSLLAGTVYHWRGRTSSFVGDLNLEHAFSAPDDAEFTQTLVQASYTAKALRTHSMLVRFRAMAPIGGDAPPQRRGILGGGGSLPTEPITRFRGDHLVFIESSYIIPINNIILPIVGSPSVEAVHLAGAAWTGDDEPQWVQNAGVGVIFALARARMVINPAERPIVPAFTFGFYIPQR
ncbi:MAG TPA: hypothetical protein VFT45_27305 [Longimicrobium sp.]|nr:hypothetical protein [Longimicrobium sp.]